MASANRQSWRRDATSSSQEKNCNTTPPRTKFTWAGSGAKCRPPPPCWPTRTCCFSRCIPASPASTAKCFSPKLCVTSAGLRANGREMVPVAEMVAFAERFGFHFEAHERGDANRSALVERNFDFIEHNFLAGRTFSSRPELNQQARQWCDRVNATYKKYLRAVPRELFVVERQHLRPLPTWIPEVYRLHERMVDVEGYVALHSNRYSVPIGWIGRRVEVRETKDKVEIQLDARHLVTHERIAEAEHQRILLAEHRPPRSQSSSRPHPHPEEQLIVQAVPEIADYVVALKQHSRKLVVLALRQLLRLVRDYPREPLLAAVHEAAHYRLYDLDRVERMILRLVARDYFLLKDREGES